MQIFFYKGERVSEGVVNLRNKLRELGMNSLILKHENSAFRGGEDKMLINWGCSAGDIQRLQRLPAQHLNMDTRVAIASNKRAFLELMTTEGVNIVPYFTSLREACQYLAATRGRIYARTKLTASSGDGIVLLMREDDPQNNNEARRGNQYPTVIVNGNGEFTGDMPLQLVRSLHDCRLFTVGHIGQRVEWRVHVFNDKVILLQKKVRTNGGEDANANTLVRNLNSGWVYSVNFDPQETDPIHLIKDVALAAVGAAGLDFGAVDIIVDKKTMTPRVLEVNTAPGLDENGSAVNAYANAILGLANE